MIEDIPDHRRVFDAADDPHGAPALRTDQGSTSNLLLTGGSIGKALFDVNRIMTMTEKLCVASMLTDIVEHKY